MLAEIAKFALDELSPCRGHEHLPAVAAGGDARGAVDVVSHIALIGQKRRSAVQADPDVHRTGRKRIREGGGRGERPGAVGKAKKKASPCVSTSTPPQPCRPRE